MIIVTIIIEIGNQCEEWRGEIWEGFERGQGRRRDVTIF